MNTPRIFSLEEATATLPYVRRVARDLVAAHRRIFDSYERQHGGTDELLEERGEFVAELELVGCEFQDIGRGLVDFRARLGNDVVFLCWRVGEPEILFWHEDGNDFRELRPIDEFVRRSASVTSPTRVSTASPPPDPAPAPYRSPPVSSR